MMAQYLDIKAQYPDALLFYRMGDFYEMFFEDAVNAAEALDIALTKRGKHDGNDIPMCGVPVHSAEGYLLTLIRKGFRVAVGEQLESPAEAKKRGSKSVVKRDVVRLVTPGTITEDSLLEARRHNFLTAYCELRDEAAIAWADISTGAFHVMPIARVRVSPELARLAPSELLVPDGPCLDQLRPIADDHQIPLTPLAKSSFDSTAAEKRVCELFKVSTLEAFGTFSRAEISAMGAVIDYLEITQKGKLPLLQPPVQEAEDRVVQIDAATRRNLELTRSLSGGRTGSLLSVVDRTVTPAGARLLGQRLSSPSRNLDVIQTRLAALDFAVEQTQLSSDLRAALRKTPDLDRALSRLALERGGPRDLAAVRNTLIQAEAISDLCSGQNMPPLLHEALTALTGFDALLPLLDAALIAEPPLLARDGGFIAEGYDSELDEARTLRDEGRSVIAALQKKYSDHTGITSLKIKHNNVLGYFIETTATHAEKMLSAPLSETYIHRQTTANQVRFTTVELSEIETRIHNAGNLALEIEKRLYTRLSDAILAEAGALNGAARGLAELDLVTALADLARGENWQRPTVDNSRAFDITGGRHPVVEQALRQQGGNAFVANDCG
ncbi:MAG: DNA mismatch repair protein MutS, partial [Pseudomonadota bacterium]|nr:DNA mismatch repair protein MutS [Pseudomonadota bacterium]